jgi:predicted ATP-grasp superfamily ATP-dependent carboligase
MGALVIVSLSARLMAESATRAGWQVLALDAFGDLDTQRVCQAWLAAGTGAPVLDGAKVLAGLRRFARDPRVRGWVAGGGFEGLPEVLNEGAEILPLLGNAPANLRRMRDPQHFFATLDHLGLAHPPVSLLPPAEPAGWLHKRFDAAGGWHIRAARASDAQLPPNPWRYWQQDLGNTPAWRTYGALFVCHGGQAHVLGIHQLLSTWQDGPDGPLPYVYHGLIGPLPQPPQREAELQATAQALCEAYGLRGLASLDFLAQDDPSVPLQILELNPRPPASMALYPGSTAADTPMALHLNACLGGPAPRPVTETAVRACALLYAQADVQLDEAQSHWLMHQPDVHDVPQPGSRFGPGDPLCNVSMTWPSRGRATETIPTDLVLQRLHSRCQALQQALLLPSALLEYTPP